jgi:CheY-like chemotaxis protein
MNAPRSPSSTRGARQALVVDDDKFVQTILSDLLRDLGVAHVTTAGNGLAAIQALDRAAVRPDVILCDLHMPGHDGFQFMEDLSSREFRGGIVLVSGMDARVLNSATLMARFHSLNILATLKKPVDAATLGAALARLA